MSIASLTKSAAIHIPNTGPQGEGHLHIVLTNLCKEKNHLLVNVSSAHNKCDRTCLLGQGDHKFIVRPSFIIYAHAAIWKEEVLLKGINDQYMTYRGQIDAKVFALICTGLLTSPRTKPIIKEYYEANKSN